MGVPTPAPPRARSRSARWRPRASRAPYPPRASGGSSSASFAAKASRWVLAGHRDGSALLWDASSGKRCAAGTRTRRPWSRARSSRPGDEPEVARVPRGRRRTGRRRGVGFPRGERRGSLDPLGRLFFPRAGPRPPPPKPSSRRAPPGGRRGASALAPRSAAGSPSRRSPPRSTGRRCRHVVASFGPMTRSRSASTRRANERGRNPNPSRRRDESAARDGGRRAGTGFARADRACTRTWTRRGWSRWRRGTRGDHAAQAGTGGGGEGVDGARGRPRDARPVRRVGAADSSRGMSETRDEDPDPKKNVSGPARNSDPPLNPRRRCVTRRSPRARRRGSPSRAVGSSPSTPCTRSSRVRARRRRVRRAPVPPRPARLFRRARPRRFARRARRGAPGDVAALAWLSSGVVVASDAEGNVVAIDPDTGAVETVDSSPRGMRRGPSRAEREREQERRRRRREGGDARAAVVAARERHVERFERFERSLDARVRGVRRRASPRDADDVARPPARFAAARSWRSKVAGARSTRATRRSPSPTRWRRRRRTRDARRRPRARRRGFSPSSRRFAPAPASKTPGTTTAVSVARRRKRASPSRRRRRRLRRDGARARRRGVRSRRARLRRPFWRRARRTSRRAA